MSSGENTIAGRAIRPSVATVFIGVTLLAWLLVLARMRGMDAGPGTDLGSLGWYVGIWITMMAAMMLPSATPMVMLFAKVSEQSSRRPGAATALFVGGYLLAWTAFGLVGYAVFRTIRGLDPAFLAWDRAGPAIAGAAIALAGVYQLTPMKRVCLRNCRTPLSFVLHHWHAGAIGAVRMGVEHGAWCIGCCWALMVLLFAVGVMSITWMLVVAATVFAEKVLTVGEQIARWLALALVLLGLWVALAPGSVPGLTIPGEGPMTSMLPAPGWAAA
jgi:predicted metal-binding membrane protein